MTSPLEPQALMPDGINSLAHERALVAANGWGPVETDRSNGQQAGGDGKPLTLNGVKYAKGYGVHAPSELKYNLAGQDRAKCVRFKAQIGLDDEVGRQGSAVFQVWGDTDKLFDSGLMTGASATQQVSVDLRGQSSFRMVVTDGGNGNNLDHANWINPALVCVPDMTISAPAEVSIYQDTHGTVPLTMTNNSRSFRGSVTYTVQARFDTDPYFQLKTGATRLTGAAQQTEKLSVYMDRQYTDDSFAAELVAWYAGEEVARTPLNLVPLEQQITMHFPDLPLELKVGKSVVVSVPVSVEPGGETTGARFLLGPNIGQTPDWLTAEVVGRGETPKRGGQIQVKFTALRNAFADELTETDAQFRLYEQNFVHHHPIQIGTVPVRLIPDDVWVGVPVPTPLQARLP
ncbi:NPCBM/NEW2 domain-containing protein [Deinococcus sp. QL22]|uniref:NPCBM/NEW2 domain-containing protein n=1 Tax=Deinococcus sp. QL22 TaxID=2939437 RepID=UPI0020170891|nr:NPCBM/NEW2 domain-containing protein [Deinococcus sp. QL22]UQN07369.1 NPCBM/NEW2 domain-containing protein [Deinococcus sp. QL22]